MLKGKFKCEIAEEKKKPTMGNWSKCKVEVEDVSGFMCVAVNQ